jgi:hypothetical protein
MSTTNPPTQLENAASLAQIAAAALQPLLPFLGPQAALAGALVTTLTNAVGAMAARGDTAATEADFQDALARDDAARADAAAAQQEATAAAGAKP